MTSESPSQAPEAFDDITEKRDSFPASDDPTIEMDMDEITGLLELRGKLEESVGLSVQWVRDYLKGEMGQSGMTRLSPEELVLHIEEKFTVEEVRKMLADFEIVKPVLLQETTDMDMSFDS